jgi:hypothetical protein
MEIHGCRAVGGRRQAVPTTSAVVVIGAVLPNSLASTVSACNAVGFTFKPSSFCDKIPYLTIASSPPTSHSFLIARAAPIPHSASAIRPHFLPKYGHLLTSVLFCPIYFRLFSALSAEPVAVTLSIYRTNGSMMSVPNSRIDLTAGFVNSIPAFRSALAIFLCLSRVLTKIVGPITPQMHKPSKVTYTGAAKIRKANTSHSPP